MTDVCIIVLAVWALVLSCAAERRYHREPRPMAEEYLPPRKICCTHCSRPAGEDEDLLPWVFFLTCGRPFYFCPACAPKRDASFAALTKESLRCQREAKRAAHSELN